VCRKLYTHDLVPGGFTDATVPSECYPDSDFHRMYVGEVEKVLERA
jgi:hypothetical protein